MNERRCGWDWVINAFPPMNTTSWCHGIQQVLPSLTNISCNIYLRTISRPHPIPTKVLLPSLTWYDPIYLVLDLPYSPWSTRTLIIVVPSFLVRLKETFKAITKSTMNAPTIYVKVPSQISVTRREKRIRL